MPNISWDSWARMLHMNFVSLMRSLSDFLMFGTGMGVA